MMYWETKNRFFLWSGKQNIIDLHVTMDLKDTYLDVPVTKDVYRRFLQMATKQGSQIWYFEFSSSVSTAPRIFFTKLAFAIIAKLHLERIIIILYLDD